VTSIEDSEAQQTAPLSQNTPVTLAVVILLVGWIVAAAATYSTFERRVSVIEEQNRRFAVDVAEMKGDIKTLLRK
jgi:hypothetical protein